MTRAATVNFRLFILTLNASQRNRDALAHPNAHGSERAGTAVEVKFQRCCSGDPRSGHAKGMAQCDGASVWVYAGVVVCDAQIAQGRQALAGEGFVEFDHVEIRLRQPKPKFSSFLVAGAGPNPMIRGATPSVKHPHDPRNRGQPMRLASQPSDVGKDQCSRAVVDAACITRP